MSEDKKKILFIGPKNPVLEEIRPQIEGTGLFGIHETTFKDHDAKEILSYLPWVVVITCPKECSKFMKAYGGVIKKTDSKVILVTEKEASKKVLHANLRFILSEYLYGNVNPKTLLHKIQFQIKSLPDISNDDLQQIATTQAPAKEKEAKPDGPRYEVGPGKEKEGNDGPHYEVGEVKKKKKEVPTYESAPVKKKAKGGVQVADQGGGVTPTRSKAEVHIAEAKPEEIEKKVLEISSLLGVSPAYIKVGKHLEEEARGNLSLEDGLAFYEENSPKVKKLEEVFEEFEVNFEDKSYLGQSLFLLNDMKDSSVEAGLFDLALFCELTRAISLRLTAVHDESVGEVVLGVLFNAAEFIESELEEIKKGSGVPLRENPDKAIFNRFHWIQKKFDSLEAPPGETFPDIQKILNALGI